MPALVIDPSHVAAEFRRALRQEIAALPEPLRLVGLIAGEHTAAHTYAEYTRKGCDEVGVAFDLRHVPKLDAEAAIRAANADPAVHGILVYYPVFGTEQDRYLRDCVEPGKDIEGLHSFWSRCLYENRRFYDAARTKKSILPCTPLAIVKLLESCSVLDSTRPRPLEGRRACVFNRSEVVGRPLASMLANDGADVVSFDIDGAQVFTPNAAGQAYSVEEKSIDRKAALASADIVVTGVPSRSFSRITAGEIRPGAVCVNFSTFANFDPGVTEKASIFIPRVGPMTVTMALRNTLRLYRNAKT
jgi:methylenetetrahydrofolate dehydrogenase (NADP+) / methenyltetrahydrofolate cyclohydrolase